MFKLRPASLGLMNQSRAIALLTATVLFAAVIFGLYWARSVMIPLALAILLTTIAAPAVKRIERLGTGRIWAVIAVGSCVALLGVGLLWLVYAQTSQLLVDIPTYQENILDKARTLQSLTHSDSRDSWSRLIERIQDSFAEPQPPGPEEAPATVATGDPFWLAGATTAIVVFGEVLGHLTLAGIITLFLLVDREDAPNRILQLVGRRQITQTTKALDDATRRISRFLRVQLIINASYGAALGAGLFVLGVKYAFLWGILAAVLRYIPYVGGSIAATLPICLALAQFSEWWPALAIIGLVIVLELIINNIVEPRLFGQSIGVSSVALIVAATFWTFLWGATGLIMAGPLTVCLVVLGKYVPQLRFLYVLLGDQAPLEPDVALYQRLIAHDEIEAERLFESTVEEKGLLAAYDSLIFPVLVSAAEDRDSGLLSDEDTSYVFEAIDRLSASASDPLPETSSEQSSTRSRLLMVAARDDDRLSAAALASFLPSTKFEVVVAPDGLIAAEVVALAEEEQVDGVCITSLPPGGLSHTKYLCKKLRAILPTVKLFVGHWACHDCDRQGWNEIPADVVSFSIDEMLKQIFAWKPVLEASGSLQAAKAS